MKRRLVCVIRALPGCDLTCSIHCIWRLSNTVMCCQFCNTSVTRNHQTHALHLQQMGSRALNAADSVHVFHIVKLEGDAGSCHITLQYGGWFHPWHLTSHTKRRNATLLAWNVYVRTLSICSWQWWVVRWQVRGRSEASSPLLSPLPPGWNHTPGFWWDFLFSYTGMFKIWQDD